ncbi:MAG: hypothetical protein IKK63_05595 [Clostridia bacterium]|nr:hypothetical protein [Clostridia bacterium]
MTLIERWKEIEDSEIIKETQLLFKNFLNAVNLFTVDENYDRIHYCVDHSDNSDGINTYGKKTGICFSEKTALENIKQILMNHINLLIPFLKSDMPTLDFGVRGLPNPIGYYKDGEGKEAEIKEAIFVFKKCDNRAGFCVSKVIPLY